MISSMLRRYVLMLKLSCYFFSDDFGYVFQHRRCRPAGSIGPVQFVVLALQDLECETDFRTSKRIGKEQLSSIRQNLGSVLEYALLANGNIG